MPKSSIHRALRPGGRHYWEISRAWQTVQKANWMRIFEVSLFDPEVSRKSPARWHFLVILAAPSVG